MLFSFECLKILPMKVFSSTIVLPKELSLFLGCHAKTGKKYYGKILDHYGKPAHGLLSLEEVAQFYHLPIILLKEFER